MINLPGSLREALLGRVCAEHEPTYLLLDSSYRVARVGADMERYGLNELRIGEPANTQVRFLEGLLPPRDLPFTLPAVEMPSGRVADVLLHGDVDGLWVVLLDVTGEIEQARLLQQKAYDIMLRSERAARRGEAWPAAATDYLNRLLQEQFRPAFLQVDVDGNVMAAGGALELYGLSVVQVGASIVDYLPLLMGLLPLQAPGDPFVIPWVNIDGGGYMDVHLVPGDGSDFVICVEALVERQERVAWQQKGNELALTKHKQAQLLESHVGKYVAEELLRGGLVPDEEGERCEASLLFCDIRGFTTFAERQPPQVVFQTLNQLLQAMVQPILDHGGWLDKMAGDAVFGAFGLIPYQRPDGDELKTTAPIRALLAAQAIMRGLRDWNDERRRSGAEALHAGIGISTGAVAVGVLGTRERRQFTIIGHHVNLAARLQTQALAGEIIIDTSTHEALGELAQGFKPRPLRLKGLQDLVTAYVLAADL